ncbi:MAG: hypothetical protein ABI625_16345 [bacterium]
MQKQTVQSGAVVLSAAKDLHLSVAVIPLLLLALALPAHAQDAKKPKAAKPPKTPSAGPAPVPPLFTSEQPLAVTFTANFGKLKSDRSETSPYRDATMSYTGADGKIVIVPIKAKTHGVWRLKHCQLPPIRLNISNKESKQTLFYDLQKPKMVSVCKNQDEYEQFVLKEMQLYRIYQTITPMSHRVRTLRVTYTDSASGKVEATRYAFVFEDPDELADRLGGQMTKVKGATADDMDADPLAVAFVFEYFIGNLDFSFNGLHNGEVVLKRDGSLAIPVAYDFDFSGAVNAPYATVDPQFKSKRVIDRVFRGYCSIQGAYPAAIALFLQKKDAIYALYRDEVGKLLEPGIVKEQLSYFDEFYDQVKTPKDAEYVTRNCVGPR